MDECMHQADARPIPRCTERKPACSLLGCPSLGLRLRFPLGLRRTRLRRLEAETKLLLDGASHVFGSLGPLLIPTHRNLELFQMRCKFLADASLGAD